MLTSALLLSEPDATTSAEASICTRSASPGMAQTEFERPFVALKSTGRIMPICAPGILGFAEYGGRMVQTGLVGDA